LKPDRKPVKNYRIALVLLVFVAFIALGMPDSLSGVGWPSMRADFGLPLDALGMLFVTATAGYLTSSFFNGKLIARMGVGGLLAASCALTGLALLGYTLVPAWWMFVLLGVASGLGAGAIAAGLNTYVAANFGEGLMQWLHASYGVGVTLGPFIMTAALNYFNAWRLGYRSVAGVQFILAAAFLVSLPLWHRDEKQAASEDAKKLTDYRTPLLDTLKRPAVWMSALMFFLYTGGEASLGAWTYSLLTESRGVAAGLAGVVTGSYWGMFTVGRILAGLVARRTSGHVLITGGLLGALLGLGLLWWNPSGTASVIGVALTGFSIAPIFPALVSGTSQRVGARYSANTIGIQLSGAGLGAAVVAAAAGALARRISLEAVPVFLFTLFALLTVLYFASRRFQPAGQSQAAAAPVEATTVPGA